MDSHGNQDFTQEKPQSPNDLFLQILQETQLKLKSMEQRMSEMAAQIEQNHEETQAHLFTRQRLKSLDVIKPLLPSKPKSKRRNR